MAVLLEQYKKYYVSWHKITSYHVTMGTPHVQTFIGSRAVVCIKMIGKVTALVNYSPKLLVYTFRARVALAEMLWHFLRSS